MQQIEVERRQINSQALTAELRAVLGEQMLGLSTRPDAIVVYLADGPIDETEIRRIVTNHDPAQLTARQQAQQQRRADLVAARAEQNEVLNVSEFESLSPAMRQLARKLRWLELEVRSLRGGE